LSSQPEHGPVICLGEALVDMVCEQPVPSLGDAPAFTPMIGGSLTNIAIAAARFGAQAGILGGAGEDEWGRWLRERIEAEGVDVSRLHLSPATATSVAFVTVSADGEPSFAFYADQRGERPVAGAAPDLEPALSGPPGVLVVGSDTLLASSERVLTMRAATLARDRGWTVLCDPNLRPRRWESEEEMLEAVGALIEHAHVVKCNAAEARALTGEAEDATAARALLERGPEAVALTRGAAGALLVAGGAETTEVPAPAVEQIVDATGAGDCVAGVLAAALAAGTKPADLAGALAVAMEAAAGVVSAWGATAGLPLAVDARNALRR
jgi:fructokinase